MSDVLWTFPVPPSALTRGPVLTGLPGREYDLAFHIESESGGEKRIALRFGDVEAYKCTHLAPMSKEMISNAYGKLTRLGSTPWFEEVVERSSRHYAIRKQPPKELQHLMICFDDGPCYEFVCARFWESTD